MSDAGDEMSDFEASHYEELVEEFLIRHADLWADFVCQQFSESVADAEDFAYDAMRDRQAEEQCEKEREMELQEVK